MIYIRIRIRDAFVAPKIHKKWPLKGIWWIGQVLFYIYVDEMSLLRELAAINDVLSSETFFGGLELENLWKQKVFDELVKSCFIFTLMRCHF